MRLLFFGDMAATGFGTVTQDLGRELLALGVDVRFVSQNPVDDLPEPFGSRTFTIRPEHLVAELSDDVGEVQGLGVSSLALQSTGIAGLIDGRLWADGWTPDTALILGDFGNVRLVVMRDETTRAAFSLVPTYHYVPIEGVDLPPSLREMWRVVKPIAMTEFGADEIAKVTGIRPPVVYHGVDTETFHPVSPERMLVVNGKKLRSKADCKRLFGAREGRWILRTDRNVRRKRYPELIDFMAPVLASHPDTTLLLHCAEFDENGSLNDWLDKDRYRRIRHQIIVTDAGGRIGRSMLVAMYNAADVYVSNSAEGFGLTIAESLACGTPAVGLDYSAVPEVIGPGGTVTPIGGLLYNEYGYFWATGHPKLLGDAVAALLDNEPERKRLGRAGVAHVRSSFQWTTAARQFAELMTPLEAVA